MKRLLFLFFLFFYSCEEHDILIKNGLIIDGTGEKGFVADVWIKNSKIIAIEKDQKEQAKIIIDASGLVVAPGFIDMLSWACGPILYDGRVHSVVRQGITTAIFGEGLSMGPINEKVRQKIKSYWPEYEIDFKWETLAEYLKYVEKKGTAINVGSFVGATTLRIYAIGMEDRQASESEMEMMKNLLRREMESGALGLGTSLVYTPAFFADTKELIELAKVAAEYHGIYVSHLRSEGAELIPALKELLLISEKAAIPAEIHHFKAAGQENWNKLDEAIRIIESAREKDLKITANIYPYTAGATQLSAMIPQWAKNGGTQQMLINLKNIKIREKIKHQISTNHKGWENFYWLSGGGKNILISYLSEKNRDLLGKSIAEIADMQQRDELETIFELLVKEKGGGGGIYFFMSEENLRKKMILPWISFCTDEDAYKPTGLMAERNPHPRAYGTFPRILGRYVREERIISLEEAIRKMTSLPAQNIGIKDRGILKKGNIADIVIFNPEKVIDNATYTNPHQFSSGIEYVFVNGRAVVEKGEHTGALPGKAIFRKNNIN